MTHEISTFAAYRKFKSFVYYDNTNLLLRYQVAEFEATGLRDKRLKELGKALQNYSKDDAYWESLITRISCWKLAKQIQDEIDPGNVISNKRDELELKVDRVTYFVDAPIELHICCALWATAIGYRLELLMRNKPYGNKVAFQKVNGDMRPVDGLRFYRPYFGQYQDWRDGAVRAAKDLVERNKSTLMMGLDIKDYYHSVRVDVKKLSKLALDKRIPDELVGLCAVIARIHRHYTFDVIGAETVSKNECILPIGLMSSGLIANYYLDELDVSLISKIKPEYYGRYVDDILLIIPCSEDQNVSDIDAIANEFLVDTGIFSTNAEQSQYVLNIEGMSNIQIQKQKLSIFHFAATEPTALLDKFVAQIRKNSSEYRLLPDDKVVDDDFNEAAYTLNLHGAGNKLRDIKEFSEDKFGVSSYLAKKIFLVLQSEHETDINAVEKVVRFFQGRRAIELYSLWEKVITFLIVNKNERALLRVVEQVIRGIELLCAGKANDWTTQDRSTYRKHLAVGLALAFSLKPSLLDNAQFKRQLDRVLRRPGNVENFDLAEGVSSFRESNLLRHHYVVQPLLNYAVKDKRLKYFDLIEQRPYLKVSPHVVKIASEQYRFSPRFVHFHEVTLFHIANRLSTSRSKFVQTGLQFGTTKRKVARDYLDAAFKDFYRLNYLRAEGEIDSSDADFRRRRKKLFELSQEKSIRALKVDDGKRKSLLKVGIANMRLPGESATHKYLRRPQIARGRQEEFNSLLNYAEREKVDVLVLPEICVPVAWVKWLADHALRQQRCFIFGLEHWVIAKRAFNFIVSMMPIEQAGLKSLVINVRLKNHYSPAETEALQGYGYIVPEVKQPYYDEINWRGCYFSAFNCYELSNITHRSMFRGRVDLLTVSEFNRDIKYFSNLIGSATRDLHCFSVQVNDARFGDSRVSQPTKSQESDIIRVKGGDNKSILVCSLDLERLREFQLKEYSGQKALGWFKPTPPDFDKRLVIKRMKGN